MIFANRAHARTVAWVISYSIPVILQFWGMFVAQSSLYWVCKFVLCCFWYESFVLRSYTEGAPATSPPSLVLHFATDYYQGVEISGFRLQRKNVRIEGRHEEQGNPSSVWSIVLDTILSYIFFNVRSHETICNIGQHMQNIIETQRLIGFLTMCFRIPVISQLSFPKRLQNRASGFWFVMFYIQDYEFSDCLFWYFGDRLALEDSGMMVKTNSGDKVMRSQILPAVLRLLEATDAWKHLIALCLDMLSRIEKLCKFTRS